MLISMPIYRDLIPGMKLCKLQIALATIFDSSSGIISTEFKPLLNAVLQK